MKPSADALVGKYRLERPLAEGGMGAVWVARHVELDVQVAVKFMHPAQDAAAHAEARFRREAKAAAQLKSPHVVQIFDYGVQDGTAYMAMELLEGEDLADLLGREGTLSLARASEIVTQAAKGLTAAHDAKIVHRDIKPSNLFLARSSDGMVVKILDFGIAKQTSVASASGKLTSSKIILGSPQYMSPEQAWGRPVDWRTDIWSLAVVLFEALTGSLPYTAEYLGELISKIGTEPAPKPSSRARLGAEVDDFFATALARDPDARFQTARAMADALTLVAAGRTAPLLLVTPSAGKRAEPDAATQAREVVVPATSLATRVTDGTGAGGRARTWVWIAVAVGGVGAIALVAAPGAKGGAEAERPADAPSSTSTAPSTGTPAAEVAPSPPEPIAAEPKPAPSETSRAAPEPRRPIGAPSATAHTAGASTLPKVSTPPPVQPTATLRPAPTAAASARVDPTFGLPVSGKP